MSSMARDWLETNLFPPGTSQLAAVEAIELVRSQPPAFQIAILRECVEQLPSLREHWSDRNVFRKGELLYAVTASLYGSKLPFEEADLCGLLSCSRHGCGHGCDVQAPLNLAISYLADHDASPALLSAIAGFAERLKGIGSIQAQTIKRRASVLLLLDRSGALGTRTRTAWSHRFSNDLEAMQADERRAWQSLLVSFKLNGRVELPNTFRKVARQFIGRVGEGPLMLRIQRWWPEPGSTCRLDTGGSHLLKHLLWILEVLPDESAFKPTCHNLVCGLSEVEWKPLQPAAKVVCAAACYLTALPRQIAWPALQQLGTMAPSREHWIGDLLASYEADS